MAGGNRTAVGGAGEAPGPPEMGDTPRQFGGARPRSGGALRGCRSRGGGNRRGLCLSRALANGDRRVGAAETPPGPVGAGAPLRVRTGALGANRARWELALIARAFWGPGCRGLGWGEGGLGRKGWGRRGSRALARTSCPSRWPPEGVAAACARADPALFEPGGGGAGARLGGGWGLASCRAPRGRLRPVFAFYGNNAAGPASFVPNLGARRRPLAA